MGTDKIGKALFGLTFDERLWLDVNGFEYNNDIHAGEFWKKSAANDDDEMTFILKCDGNKSWECKAIVRLGRANPIALHFAPQEGNLKITEAYAKAYRLLCRDFPILPRVQELWRLMDLEEEDGKWLKDNGFKIRGDKPGTWSKHNGNVFIELAKDPVGDVDCYWICTLGFSIRDEKYLFPKKVEIVTRYPDAEQAYNSAIRRAMAGKTDKKMAEALMHFTEAASK